jgi:hypothetical protein
MGSLQCIGAIAEAGVINCRSLKQVSALFLAIAEGAGIYAGGSYKALAALAEAVKVKEQKSSGIGFRFTSCHRQRSRAICRESLPSPWFLANAGVINCR